MNTYTQEQRNKVIEELSIAAELLSVGQVRDWDDLSETLKCAAHMLVAPSTSQWIAASDSMPRREDVIVYSPDLRNPTDMLIGRFMDGKWMCAGYEMVNTTHWMPLPAAPIKEGGA